MRNFPRVLSTSEQDCTHVLVLHVQCLLPAKIFMSFVQSLVPHLDTSPNFGKNYFVYYNQVLSFAVITLIPAVALIILNSMIFRRLQVIPCYSLPALNHCSD